MSTNYERNAHFQGSAQQVTYKILDLIPNSLHTYSRDDQKLVAELIAQYAYDVAVHGLSSLFNKGFGTSYYDPEEVIRDYIPDLTAWPEPPTTVE